MAAELLTLLFHVVWAVCSGLEPVSPPMLKLPDRKIDLMHVGSPWGQRPCMEILGV